MAQSLEQTQQSIQTQQLSTLQVAVAKMVELPITELAARVQDEMVDNAALEEKDNDNYPDSTEESDNMFDSTETDNDSPDSEFDDNHTEQDVTNYEENDSYGNDSDVMGDYLTADDVPDYLRQRAEEQDNRGEYQLAGYTSFYEELQKQINEYNLNETEQQLLEYLIGSLDEDGFLRKELSTVVDELVIYHGIETTVDDMERLLNILQHFEPRGIGARSLQECLHIQLTDPERRTPYTEYALTVIDKYFNDFVKHHWDILKTRLKVDEETFNHIIHELTHLNPMPGSAMNDTIEASAPTVVPDFYVQVNDDNEITVSLNQGDVPELRISRAFSDSLKQFGNNRSNLSREQKDAYTYARQKVDAARSFINLLSRRRQTLLSVMHAIVENQKDFFLNDDDELLLKPMTLKEVAAMANVDISTVSRVTSSKYVQTYYNTYPLKFFFSTQFTASDGNELSARLVKAKLEEIISNEDKKHPLADELLATALKEAGFNVARRTVAKYRDMLGYPTARLRKEI